MEREYRLASALLFTALTAVWAGIACDDADDSSQNGSDTDSDSDPPQEADAISGATPGVKSAVLDTDHEGWKQADCFSCHDSDHANNYVLGDCVSCHGKNGAPTRPQGHDDQGCLDCHDNRHQDPPLTSNESCRACHAYALTQEPCAYEETYDAIVVGGGGGGLAAASVLAQNGLKVLVVEQHYKAGGCMVAFNRGEYRFEASLHAYDGWGISYLDALGIRDALVPKKGEIMYRLVSPDMTFDVPADKDAYREALKKAFPEEADHIDSLFDNFNVMNFDLYEGMSLLDAVMFYGIENELLIEIFTVLSGFLAATADELPAQNFIGMWDSYHSLGYYYFEGGSQSITDALEEKITSNGGVIKRHTRADRIVVEDNQVKGIRTEDGGCYTAKAVISDAGAKVTFFSLVGQDLLPAALIDEVSRRVPASSNLAMVFLGVDADYIDLFPGGTHEIFVAGEDFINSDSINEVRCSPEAVSFVITDYSVVDPLAAPDGKNTIVITADFMDYDCSNQWNWGESYDSYEEYKAEVARVLVERAEVLLPGLSEHIEVLEAASPKTIEQFTLNEKGSWAGWAFEPDEEHVYTDTIETPVGGLYLAGAWTAGSGQSAALSSGISAANAASQEFEL